VFIQITLGFSITKAVLVYTPNLGRGGSLLLLLVLDKFNVILRYLLVLLKQELLQLNAHITLHDNFFPTTRKLRN
jgi:hypothetical protein